MVEDELKTQVTSSSSDCEAVYSGSKNGFRRIWREKFNKGHVHLDDRDHRLETLLSKVKGDGSWLDEYLEQLHQVITLFQSSGLLKRQLRKASAQLDQAAVYTVFQGQRAVEKYVAAIRTMADGSFTGFPETDQRAHVLLKHSLQAYDRFLTNQERPVEEDAQELYEALTSLRTTDPAAGRAAQDRDRKPAAAVAGNIRWLLGSLLMFGAPEATVVLMTVVPRAQLSDADLSVFRQLSDALRDVAADFGPRCVLLDVERLLNAESSAPDSWRRRVSFHGLLGGAVVRAVEEGSGDAWSLSPLPQDFPRLGVKDFGADGVHLHGLLPYHPGGRGRDGYGRCAAAADRRGAGRSPAGHAAVGRGRVPLLRQRAGPT
ncbi:hypothetical protein FJT64_016985 [Amphibalanus amphitrite]|uniref:Uncharacterized protein n=1 Tax=Amphibalanus amphitrite TaxID=1232801 RepID=A0A6A4XAP5_AMPAM|nr:hypothetical protein FJT64_016985 [Amphibalanus amphitrite]